MHTVQSAWGSRPPDVHSPSLQQRLHGVVAAWPQGSVDKKDRIHALLKDRVAPLRWWRFSRIWIVPIQLASIQAAPRNPPPLATPDATECQT